MIDEVTRACEDGLTRIDGAQTLDELAALDVALLGRRGTFTLFKTQLGSLATADEKREAGRALNDATQRVSAAVEASRCASTSAIVCGCSFWKSFESCCGSILCSASKPAVDSSERVILSSSRLAISGPKVFTSSRFA